MSLLQALLYEISNFIMINSKALNIVIKAMWVHYVKFVISDHVCKSSTKCASLKNYQLKLHVPIMQ